jgi:hypothetical protein
MLFFFTASEQISSSEGKKRPTHHKKKKIRSWYEWGGGVLSFARQKSQETDGTTLARKLMDPQSVNTGPHILQHLTGAAWVLREETLVSWREEAAWMLREQTLVSNCATFPGGKRLHGFLVRKHWSLILQHLPEGRGFIDA